MRMPYSVSMLWHERHRYTPAVFAVTFSALLIALQFGLLLGLLAVASRPIDRSRAHIWAGSREVPTLGFSHPIPDAWRARLDSQPEIVQTEPYLFGFANWHMKDGGLEMCYVIGTRLDDDSLGVLTNLTPSMRALLTEPGAVVVNHSDLRYLGLARGVGETAELNGRRVRVVGVMTEVVSPGMMAGVFCSMRTAQELLPGLQSGSRTMYILGRCRDPEDVPRVVRRLREMYPDMSVIDSDEFSLRTQMHWLIKTRVGFAFGFAAILGLMVGAAVTSQTLYGATAASLREYAVLRALGIPRPKMKGMVLAKSFWIGMSGIALAVPLVLGAGQIAHMVHLELRLHLWLLASTAILTLVMAMASGLVALRSLRLADPIVLLR
jgi:putative ABC transport system permease protein